MAVLVAVLLLVLPGTDRGLLLAAPAAGDPAVAARPAELRAAPSNAAPRTGDVLSEGESVTVTELSGRWARVRRADGSQAWVAASDLRLGGDDDAPEGTSRATTDWLRQLTGLLAPREPPPAASTGVTIGVRGLDQNDIATAQPDPDAVDRMERYRADRSAAYMHAGRQGLVPRVVSYAGSSPGAGN